MYICKIQILKQDVQEHSSSNSIRKVWTTNSTVIKTHISDENVHRHFFAGRGFFPRIYFNFQAFISTIQLIKRQVHEEKLDPVAFINDPRVVASWQEAADVVGRLLAAEKATFSAARNDLSIPLMYVKCDFSIDGIAKKKMGNFYEKWTKTSFIKIFFCRQKVNLPPFSKILISSLKFQIFRLQIGKDGAAGRGDRPLGRSSPRAATNGRPPEQQGRRQQQAKRRHRMWPGKNEGRPAHQNTQGLNTK